MSKIDAWKCEICEKVFMPETHNYDMNSEVQIDMGFEGEYVGMGQYFDYNFEDVCLGCRQELSKVIENFISSKKENK